MNRFAIDSKGVGDALMRSASAMAMAGNTMHEAVGLAAAGNTVVQNPEKVGTALKTLSLRLRSTKKELEEAGEETDGMAESVTQLQAQLYKLTHDKVDIMQDSGQFKNTTQIIREMSAAWAEMNDMERAEALEAMAGKNQANVLAAIIQNFDIAEQAIETSANSAGSALKENEKYLNSIEGKIQQFKNALQGMWSAILDDGFIKWIVDAGTWILKAVEWLGLFKTALLAITLVKFVPWIVSVTTGLEGYGAMLVKLGKWMFTAQGSSVTLGAAIGNLAKAFKAGGMSVKDFASGLGSLIAKSPVTSILATAAAIAVVVAISKSAITTLEEQEEKFTELNNALESTETELNDLKSQLEETSAQIDELNGKESLSLVEEEELDRLKQQSAELQRQIDLKETLQKYQQKEVNNQATEITDEYQNANFETGKGKSDYQESGATWGAIAGGVAAAIGILLAPFTGGLSAAATVGVTAGAGLLGAGIGAGIGYGAGGAYADSQEQVGESINNMYERRIELQQKLNKAQAEYRANPGDEDAAEAYGKAEKALTDYDSKMSEHLAKMDSYYSSIDLSVYDPVLDAEKIRDTRKEIDDFYDTQDKWAIGLGGTNAKQNAIDRIFGKNASGELKKVKKAFEDANKAGKQISLKEAFDIVGLSGDFDAFNSRLQQMGLRAHEVELAFRQTSEAAEEMMSTDMYDSSKDVGKAKAGVEGITDALNTAQKEGYLTADALDSIAETLGGADKLGDAWTHFAEVMSTNTSTLKEQREAAEALVETYLDNNIMSGGPITPKQKGIYVTQLQDMGIWNAEEYVDDRNLENMYKDIQNSAEYDWNAVQNQWLQIQKDWANGSNETVQKIKAAGLNEKKAWSELTTDQKNIVAETMNTLKKVSEHDVKAVADEYGYELPIYIKLDDNAPQEIKDELEELSQGGNVDISVRPQIDASYLNEKGWNAGDGIATVFTSTISNTDFADLMPQSVEGTIALNFTPIMVDPETGQFMGVMSETELYNYAHDVIAGVREDDLHLQIGAQFTGKDAIVDASEAANRIHEIHQGYFVDDGKGAQRVADLYNTRNEKAQQYQDILKKEKEIADRTNDIKDIEDLENAYKRLEDTYGQREYGNAVSQKFDAEQAWKTMYDVSDPMFNDETLKVQFEKDYDAFKALYGQMQLEFQDVDLSSLEKVQEFKKTLEDEKIKLQAEYDNASTPELKAELEAQIEEIDKQLEALTPDVEIQFSFNMDEVRAEVETVKQAVSEAMSGSGMTADSVNNLEAIFGEFDNYDASKLFEKNELGIRLNIDALRDLQAQQEKQNKEDIAARLKKLTDEYERYGEVLRGNYTAQEKLEAAQQMEMLEPQIQQVQTLQAEYEGLTSAYQKWLDAQAGPDVGDNYDSIVGSVESSKELRDKNHIGTEKFRRTVQLYSAEYEEGMSPQELAAAYDKIYPTIKKFFTEGQQGAEAFVAEAAKFGHAVKDAQGNWTIVDDTSEIAESLGISTELVDIMYDQFERLGLDVNFGPLYADIDRTESELAELAKSLDLEINFKTTNKGDLEKEISKIKKKFDELKGKLDAGEITADNTDLLNAQIIYGTLLAQKYEFEKPAVLKIDTSNLNSETQAVMTKLNALYAKWSEFNQLNITGLDTTKVQGEIDTLLAGLTDEEVKILTDIGINEESLTSVESLVTSLAELPEDKITKLTTETSGKDEVDKFKETVDGFKNKNVSVTAKAWGTPQVTKLADEIGRVKSKSVTINAKVNTSEGKTYSSDFVGPLRPGDTRQDVVAARGTAFAQGNWGTSKSGTALGGELGPEIVVRDGRWFTIGDNGAEFFEYKKDDIIFNAAQTEQILEKGKITAGNRRGKALAGGTAFAEGTAFAPGSVSGSFPAATSQSHSSSSSNKSSSDDNKEDESALEQLKKRYQKAISNAENWAEYMENEASLIEAKGLKVSSEYLQNQINQQHQIIAVYTEQRDALYELLATQEEGTDEWLETSEAIWEATNNIQQANIAIEGYRQKEVDNYVESLEKELEETQNKHDYKISNKDNQIEYVENDIAYREALDQLPTRSHYETLANIENEKIEQLIAKRADLQSQMAKLESEGQKGTDIWYEYAEALWETEKSIQASTTAAVRYRKEIINLYDEAFSRIGEAYGNKISINDDAISSMENYAELLDLRGGTATKGLYNSMITTTQSNIATKWEQFNEQNKIVEALKAEANPYADGTDEWEAFELARNEGIVAARAEMRQLKLDIQSDEIAVEQLKEEFKELATQRWDDVQKAYENRDTYYNNQTSLIDSYINRFDTLNMNTPDELIEAQIESQESANASKWSQYLDARKAMIEYESIYGADSQEYIDKYNETIALHQEWQEGYNKVLESQQQIIDNQWDRYDQVMDRVNDATEDLQRISDLIADEDVATESGEWTDEGLTRLGLAYQQMEYNKQIAKDYADEIDTVTRQYNRGEISEKKYYERLQELEDGQWSAIEAYETQKDAIVEINEARVDLIEEGLDKELEAYQELIDLKKEELDSERDLYTFKKNVANQTKNIAALERRIASMSGSSDASTIAERTKLEAQLREAKESLDDTYYNHATDAQSKALDDEMKAFEKSSSDYLENLRESIKNTDELITGTYTEVLENGSIVLDTLETLSRDKGFVIEQNLLSPWDNSRITARTFKNEAVGHIQDIIDDVNSKNPTLEQALGQSFYDLSYDKDGNPLYEYSKYGKKQIDAIITEAKTRRGEMQSELGGGFEDAKSSITTFESDATSAVDKITEAFVGTDEKPGGLLKAIQDVSEAINNMPDIDAEYNPKVTVPGGGVNTGGTKTPTVDVSKPASNDSDNGGSGGTGAYSGSYSTDVWNLQKVLVSAFGHPVAYNKKTGQYSRTPDGLWGSVTEDSLKKTQKELGVGQSGRFDETTRKALSTFLTNQYNNASDNKPYETALQYLPKKAFAKGTLGTTRDYWALTDESWIGEEITLAAGKNGQLQYLKKGSAVMPADISANLVEWGKLNPNTMGIGDMSNGIQMMSNYINKPEIKLDIENFLNVGAVSKDTLPELERLMDKKIDTFAKQLNAGIRKFK